MSSRGVDDQAPHDESRVLARLDHPGEPEQRRVRVGATDRLDERADDVVVASPCGRTRRPPCWTASATSAPSITVSPASARSAAASSPVSATRASPAGDLDEVIERVGGRASGRAPPSPALRPRTRARTRPRGRPLRAARAGAAGTARAAGDEERYGFSVVAPISVTVPSSTAGSRTSCCAFDHRWTSSTNRTVVNSAAGLVHHLPRVRDPGSSAESVRAGADRVASRWASVVLPVPAGPRGSTRAGALGRSAS